MNFDKREDTQGQVYYPLACMKGMDGLFILAGQMVLPLLTPKRFLITVISPSSVPIQMFPSS
jgi:hypothetical protein